jgi:hypothetical protein
MFFPLSKILGFFAIPSNLVVSIGILGVLLLPTRFARAGRTLAFASLIVLAILGLSPVGNALIIPLEERFPRWDATRGAPEKPTRSTGAHAGPKMRCARSRAWGTGCDEATPPCANGSGLRSIGSRGAARSSFRRRRTTAIETRERD